jgi:ATP-binding cassette subfamily B protein
MSNKLDNERTMTNKELFKKLFRYLKPELGKFLLAILMLMISVGCGLAIPYLNGETIKVMGATVVDYNAILKIALMFVGVCIIAFGSEYTQAMLLQHAGQSIIYTVRMDVFRHLEYTSIEQINQIPIGKLVTRVTNDTNALNELFTDVLINLLKSLVTLIGVIIFMFINNVKLASYMVTLMPFILVMTFAFNFWTRKAYRKVRKNLSEINASLSENLSGMKITQVFNAEEKQYKEFQRRNKELEKSNIKQIFIIKYFTKHQT